MLENTNHLLTHQKRLTVGYFGGSITEGACASDPAYCWRGLTNAWLRETYPDCEIADIQAAIGGTGSDLGIFRLEHDLLSKSPDLIFIEFSTNDSGRDYYETLADSETLVRKILQANPCADIVYVHTQTKGIADRLALGIEHNARAAHSTVMRHYHLPQIDIGEVLRTRILLEGGDWLLYTADNVHPNDAGYRIYADAMIDFLKEALAAPAPDTLAEKALPVPLGDDKRLASRLVDAPLPLPDGWTLVTDKTLCGRYPRYIEATVPGTELSFTFEGRRVGIYMMMASDSGDVEFSLDGSPFDVYRTWDFYCERFDRANAHLFCDELPYGEHTLTLRVASTHAEKSKGTAIRIGAFMVY